MIIAVSANDLMTDFDVVKIQEESTLTTDSYLDGGVDSVPNLHEVTVVVYLFISNQVHTLATLSSNLPG